MASTNDTGQISDWKSIITLVVFLLTNVVVLFPFHIPIYVPRLLSHTILSGLALLRIIAPAQRQSQDDALDDQKTRRDSKHFLRFRFPMNFVTAPLIADLFLLAIKAIGRKEVHDGTIGANNISPLDIMIFFITLAYIAISIDASGLIRWLAFKVLQWGGEVGHKLFFYLYAFFFGLGTFIGNDPIILSGTAFLAYMTRVSKNINHPKAWIYSQFAVANIASAILVSSNPTNLVLAGAFDIKFIHYTANMIVPVFVTAIVLFPFLLYIVFADPLLIPTSIEMETLSEEQKAKAPINPNIPYARGNIDTQDDNLSSSEQRKLLPLEEIMNPFLDKGGAAFGAVIMAATLITLLALNAASTSSGEHPVFWVTLPAAFVMFCWDVAFGWHDRENTREIARKGRRHHAQRARAERLKELEESARRETQKQKGVTLEADSPNEKLQIPIRIDIPGSDHDLALTLSHDTPQFQLTEPPPDPAVRESDESRTVVSTPTADRSISTPEGKISLAELNISKPADNTSQARNQQEPDVISAESTLDNPHETPQTEHVSKEQSRIEDEKQSDEDQKPTTVVSLLANGYIWLQDTFPTATVVISHLPFALIPFAFAMFVLVQALVTKGWVEVFAHGWDHWVNRTGTLGSIGGMGFLSVVLCNPVNQKFAGTNIGTTILLSRVIQEWVNIHHNNGTTITDRTFWGTVYSMALGVNYGAFSTAFSASLAGLLWRDILARKHIHVKGVEFARVNFPIIAIAMVVGCATLVGEVYIMRDSKPYSEFT
ncbi:hypothetical protein AK830_g6075 [Neonectria ditissima]|uniref:Citrate transporter-like domain-containing protein n=1 Tax=Neonectria ditissima TaxID=78410 RepID=A0A0P7B384_9HYPO|nr:hypothetical protein AK830_g6075 [Neonectria ditissima]